jgi:poly [ADP-ribose] polymerase
MSAILRGQSYINDLVAFNNNGNCPVSRFNGLLNDLFTIIPRKMTKVENMLAKDPEDYVRIIEKEQQLLDIMESRVKNGHKEIVEQEEKGNAKKRKKKNVLEEAGIDIKLCKKTETARIKRLLDRETKGISGKVYKVINKETQEAFDKYVKDNGISESDCHLYFHGTRNQNYWPVITSGLRLKPANNVSRAGHMFGYGLYFAPKAKKSCGYTSLQHAYWTGRIDGSRANDGKAMLAVFNVAMGKQYDMDEYSPEVSHWKEKDCKKAGYDSIYAHAGRSLRNDEAVVFNEAACTIAYLIELND